MSEPPHKRARMDAGPGAAAAAGPTPQPAAASASEPAALTAPPLTRLHRHALESIFAFLSFREIRSVMFASRDWLAAVYSMRGVGHTLTRLDELPGGLRSLLRSRLARHITSLGDKLYTDLPSNRRVSCLRVSCPLLRQICSAMPFLSDLTCIPLNGEERRDAFPLPSSLTQLGLGLPQGMDDGSVNELLAEVATHQCIRELHLYCNADGTRQRLGAGVDFSALAAMPALRELYVDGVRDVSDEQVTQLRSLTHLSQLSLDPCPPGLLSRLLAPGHQLGWTELGYGMVINDVSAPLLPTLPHLAVLRCSGDGGVAVDIWQLDWLVPLTQLTLLQLNLRLFDAEVHHSLLTLPLHFPHLATFILENAPFSSAELGTLLSRMPRLVELEVRYLQKLESLTFLRAPPLRSTLRSLSLCMCEHPDMFPSGLTHLDGMPLTSLVLFRRMAAPLSLDDAHWDCLEPPSRLLPQLVHFEYEEFEED